jgi:hypothetical protein
LCFKTITPLWTDPTKRALPHLLDKYLISRILKNLDLLWKRIAKKSRFPISSSRPEDGGEPF